MILIIAGRGYILDKCPVQADDLDEIMLTAQPRAMRVLDNNVRGSSGDAAPTVTAAPTDTAPKVDKTMLCRNC